VTDWQNEDNAIHKRVLRNRLAKSVLLPTTATPNCGSTRRPIPRMRVERSHCRRRRQTSDVAKHRLRAAKYAVQQNVSSAGGRYKKTRVERAGRSMCSDFVSGYSVWIPPTAPTVLTQIFAVLVGDFRPVADGIPNVTTNVTINVTTNPSSCIILNTTH
jgi:hypothetical protein